jgi:hypothetical protein
MFVAWDSIQLIRGVPDTEDACCSMSFLAGWEVMELSFLFALCQSVISPSCSFHLPFYISFFITVISWNSIHMADIATRLQAGWQRNCGLLPHTGNRHFSSPNYSD